MPRHCNLCREKGIRQTHGWIGWRSQPGMACEPKQRSSEAVKLVIALIALFVFWDHWASVAGAFEHIRRYSKLLEIWKTSDFQSCFRTSHIYSAFGWKCYGLAIQALSSCFRLCFFSDPNKQDQMSMEWEISTNQALMTEAIHLWLALPWSEKYRHTKKLKIARQRHTEHGVPEKHATKWCRSKL